MKHVSADQESKGNDDSPNIEQTPTSNESGTQERISQFPSEISDDDYKLEKNLSRRRKPGMYLGMTGLLMLIILTFFVLLAHLGKLGYQVNDDTIVDIQTTRLIDKDGPPIYLKTISFKNDFITPRKIIIPTMYVCLEDVDVEKEKIQLVTQYFVEVESSFYGNESTERQPGDEVWVYPFSTLNLDFMAKGDWYDYILQYLEYDELQLIVSDSPQDGDSCDSLNLQAQIDKIAVIKEECLDCVKAVNGVDLAVVDFIVNDNKIWENGFISFVPIIKNVGDKPSGPFKVTYFLNGKHSSSFQLENLNSGEIVNNFIAGSGFQGNFGIKNMSEMELKIEVEVLKAEDQDPGNNIYIWNFQYSDKPLPKHTCTYTDNNQGPEDFYSAETIEYNDKSYFDLCLDENYLLEYNCDEHPAYKGDNNIDVFLYRCPSGCKQGACVGDPDSILVN